MSDEPYKSFKATKYKSSNLRCSNNYNILIIIILENDFNVKKVVIQ